MALKDAQTAADVPSPEVIVDFKCEDGALFVVLKNSGQRSAYRVTTEFDKPLHGLGGTKCISELALFRRVEFMPAGKEFVQLVDAAAAWFRRRGPTKYAITISYTDREGHRYSDRIIHDLKIYRDLGYSKIVHVGANYESTG
jgi:hypothetical protein